jgi:tetratricopeptide (TPR) repeat protein
MRPTGREESVQPELALYFGDRPPTSIGSKLLLGSMEIDIPPGDGDHVVRDSFTLPVDVEVRAILPHAHYLAKGIRAWAVLPDGRNEWLLLIRNWDFNWQGDYRYVKPVLLSRNSRIEFEIHYDNSADNPRNPNHPPKRVHYGAESSDEMAELWLQVVLRSRQDAETLMESTRSRFYRDKILFNQYVLRRNPGDARGHNELGRAFLMTNRGAEAFQEFQEAIRLQPDFDEPHYYLGILHRQRKEPAKALEEFELALRINPRNGRAHGNLGLVFLEQGQLEPAESHFRSALSLDPDDQLARESLAQVLEAKTRAGSRK